MRARGWPWSSSSSGSPVAAIAVTVLATLWGCTDPPARPPARPASRPPASGATSSSVTLRLVNERNVRPHTTVDGQSFGGISALVFRERDRQLLALSDGRAEHGPGRMFVVDADRLEPSTAVLFGAPIATRALDLEAMARASDGSLWIATEGDGKRSPRLPPAIFRVSDDGRVLGEVPIPKQLEPTPLGPLRHGVRTNRGIEGLTAAAAGGGRVVAAVEQACAQDGPPATLTSGTTSRLIVYDNGTPHAQHAYLTDPLPPATRPGKVTAADIGISALAAIDRDRVLVMERAGVAVDGVYSNRIRIYEITLAGASDVSTLEALPPGTPVLDKRLVLDFDQVVGELDPAYGRLDNFEAMALGTGPDGSQRLYVASDDNFSDDQRTALLVFVVEGS